MVRANMNKVNTKVCILQYTKPPNRLIDLDKKEKVIIVANKKLQLVKIKIVNLANKIDLSLLKVTALDINNNKIPENSIKDLWDLNSKKKRLCFLFSCFTVKLRSFFFTMGNNKGTCIIYNRF
jgi:hypothetical protein